MPILLIALLSGQTTTCLPAPDEGPEIEDIKTVISSAGRSLIYKGHCWSLIAVARFRDVIAFYCTWIITTLCSV